MSTFIQANQQLLMLGSLLLLVMAFLWVLQYLIIRYSKKVFIQIGHYYKAVEQYFGLRKRFMQFKDSYPKSYHFLWQRLHVEHFYGLPLTVLFLVMGYILALFIGLVEDVVTSDSIVAIDYFVSQQMSLLSESFVVQFFILITSLGSTPITCLVVLLTGVVCWVIRQRFIFIGLLIAIIGSTVFTFISKLLFHRVRPVDILLFEQTFSFPSGHATVTIALYGFIAYIAIRFNQDFSKRVRIIVVTVFFSILLGLSRIVLNEHYLSDVFGGYLVGALWLTVAISVTEWLRARNKVNWQIEWSSAHTSLVWLCIACVIISTILYANFYQFPLLL